MRSRHKTSTLLALMAIMIMYLHVEVNRLFLTIVQVICVNLVKGKVQIVIQENLLPPVSRQKRKKQEELLPRLSQMHPSLTLSSRRRRH